MVRGGVRGGGGGQRREELAGKKSTVDEVGIGEDAVRWRFGELAIEGGGWAGVGEVGVVSANYRGMIFLFEGMSNTTGSKRSSWRRSWRSWRGSSWRNWRWSW